MARRTTITEEQLLTAAREVFLEHGIRATTAKVAARAGVAEGSIFKRFPTKFDLFRAATHYKEEPPPWLVDLATQAGTGDLRNTLIELGLRMLERFQKIVPLMMMRWSNPEATGNMVDSPIRSRTQLLANYFEAEIRLGRLRSHDPSIIARVFTGSIQNYVFHEVIMMTPDEQPLSPEIFIQGLVDLILVGAAQGASLERE